MTIKKRSLWQSTIYHATRTSLCFRYVEERMVTILVLLLHTGPHYGYATISVSFDGLSLSGLAYGSPFLNGNFIWDETLVEISCISLC